MAVDIIRSTMETADGIAIIELQDRSWGCLTMMSLNWLFFGGIISFWRGHERSLGQKLKSFFPNCGIFAAAMGTLLWDGLASCIRTRQFSEFVKLVDKATDHVGFVFPSIFIGVKE